MTTTIPPETVPRTGEGFTVEDWLALPEDGLRHELIDGSYYVSAAPVSRHQRAVNRLIRLLDARLPAELTTDLSGCGVATDDMASDRALIPDALVTAAKVAVRDAAVVGPEDGVLAVEVVSPSSRRRDHGDKREMYADWGIEHYWVVDLAPTPKVTVLRLRDGAYAELATGPVVEVTEPVALRIDVADLTG